MPPRKILVVEDDPDSLRGLELFLAREGGYTVLGAGDGLTALDMMQKEPPDLIILDVGLPGMDGVELLRRIKSLGATASIPVVVLTARGAALVPHMMAAGVAAFIQKPADMADLMAAVRGALWQEGDPWS